MNNIYQSAAGHLSQKRDFVFATITSQDGSTPRGAGSKMLVLANETKDTIGGGLMEAQVIKRARQMLQEKSRAEILHFDLSSTQAALTDFICGGKCEILLFYFDAHNPHYLPIFEEASQLSSQGGMGWLITVYNRQDQQAWFGLQIKNGPLLGSFGREVDQNLLRSPLNTALHQAQEDNLFYFFDPVQTADVIYLFGAGHISAETAKITTMLGCATVVVDDRAEFLTAERFPGCRLVLIEDFENLPDFPIDQDSCLLIITRGHLYDQTVLRWALKQEAGYIGMIGSIPKRDQIYEHLKKEGVASQQLEQVYCPIGLDIGAQTPAEIGVSIVAELIAVRNGMKFTRESKEK